MIQSEKDLWKGLSKAAQKALSARDYKIASFDQRLTLTGVDAGELGKLDRTKPENAESWIPGVEIFPRTIFPQRHRGSFGEFVRRDEGILSEIGLWPKQWSAARMFAGTAKGFHVHPPSIPGDISPADWYRRVFVTEAKNLSLRRYDQEQWDVMFFVQGAAEMFLHDVREGLPSRTMRFFVDGDNRRSANNVGIVVPPGVAHAIRAEGSEDVIMVYGTTTAFQPQFEGRIGSEIETSELPPSWREFLAR